MGIIIFLLFSFSLALVLFVHSYRLRGLSITINFFLFIFFLIFTRGEYPGLSYINLEIKPAILWLSFSLVTACLGVSVIYISWQLAEKLTQGLYWLKEKILPVVLVSGVICACFIYAIGLTVIYLGWWQKEQSLVLVILEWFYFCMYFLSAFFLISYSKFKNFEWKAVFFILPFIPAWSLRIFKVGQVLFLIEYIGLILIVSLLLFTNLKFDYSIKVKE
jgi:hypothetical protein